ncbi:hypothetical protein [Aeromonas veronii]|uniref:hypothetical protein n=1 Tax=Aeromonas veronii TaxID=654 RepID=UPI002444DEB3|nr:hypothetical protein [Aeromonas veronii]
MTREVLNNLLNRLYGEMTIALGWKEKLVLQRRFIALSRGARKYHANDIAGDALPCAAPSSCWQNWRSRACSGMARWPYAR